MCPQGIVGMAAPAGQQALCLVPGVDLVNHAAIDAVCFSFHGSLHSVLLTFTEWTYQGGTYGTADCALDTCELM